MNCIILMTNSIIKLNLNLLNKVQELLKLHCSYCSFYIYSNRTVWYFMFNSGLNFCQYLSSGHLNKLFYSFFVSSGRILVDDYPNGSDEFWKPVLQMASAAVISSNFLSKLGRDSSFFMRNCPTGKNCNILKKLLLLLSYHV